MIGTRVGSYRIIEKLGHGGMGEVYKAEDERLKRLVAIKVLRQDLASLDQDQRFLQEARAVSALNHPNIVQIYELESVDGSDCIVMEFVPGRTLAQLLHEKRLDIDQTVSYACQIAAALTAAHAAGIVHRDIKPGNLVITETGVLKVLDFGLAKRERAIAVSAETLTAAPETAVGTVVGTAFYMSPEQAEGKRVDARSDIFSTGAVLYEMLTGVRAFEGDSTLGVLSKVLQHTPQSIHELRPEVPPALERIVDRCLEKDPALRYTSGLELAADLEEYRRPARPAASSRKMQILTAAVLIAAIGITSWFYFRNRDARWVRNEALPNIQKLVLKDDYAGAFELTRTALRYAPDDPQLKQHWANVSVSLTMTTVPAGAKISIRPFNDARGPWHPVGTTPLKNVPVPGGYVRVRVEKDRYETWEFAAMLGILQDQTLTLYPSGKVPDGMLPVPSNAPWARFNAGMALPDYFIDKYEVTNGQFQKFVDAGGYRDRKFWTELFSGGRHDISWEQAQASFVDRTGRPAPSTWQLGAFPKDQANFPVSGLSWFEAAAYCRFAGKALPTVHHWNRAAGFSIFRDILLSSNFSGKGPATVGENPGITTFGAYDMAGNVKEWGQTSAGDRRVILGGGWNEPSYMFHDSDAQDPFTRLPAYGVRCAVFPTAPPSDAMAPLGRPERDYSIEKPVSDGNFELIRGMYAYDKLALDAKTENIDDSHELWRKEKVSYTAAYGGERIPAYLFLPKAVKPPYQTVVWVPGGYALFLRNSETGLQTDYFDFLIRTGRAVLYPIYKGTFERHGEPKNGPLAARDWAIQFTKDVSRSVDFLESRPDIQSDRLAYLGLSLGGVLGPIHLAVEHRFKTGILIGGGLYSGKSAPESDVLNFAPRVPMPVLMLAGKDDFERPVATMQQPLFKLLGSKPAEKRFILFESGHVPPIQDVMRETLNWLDRYLGPVK